VVNVGIEWVNKFPTPCDKSELDYCDETAVGFLQAMENQGHVGVFNYGNSAAWETDFRDTAAFGGNDKYVVDKVDFVYFSSHGKTTSDEVFFGHFGNKRDKCAWRSDKARLGNLQLEWLALDTCSSLELTRDIIEVWHNAFYGLHMILGFTGLASDSWLTATRGYKFGERTGWPYFLGFGRIGTAWLDACYTTWAADTPVAMAAGRSESDAKYRRDRDTLDSGLSDIPHNEIKYYAWKYRS
jgi:hypothetical protein